MKKGETGPGEVSRKTKDDIGLRERREEGEGVREEARGSLAVDQRHY